MTDLGEAPLFSEKNKAPMAEFVSSNYLFIPGKNTLTVHHTYPHKGSGSGSTNDI